MPFLRKQGQKVVHKNIRQGPQLLYWDFKNKVHTKRSYMHIIIIPEQIVENPNFKLILVVKE
jgi:hypothetical protein